MEFDGIQVVEAVAAGCALLVLVVLAWLVRKRVALSRRLAVVTTRLEPAGTLDVSRRARLEHALAGLERAAGAAVAERQEAEVAEGRLAAAFDAIAAGVLVCDEHGRLVFGNTRARELLGARHEQQVAEGTVGKLLTIALSGGTREESLELIGPPRRSLRLASFPLYSDTGVLGAVAVVDDVSEQRRLQSVRRDFVANVTDELAKPVTALATLAEALHDEADAADVSGRLARRVHREATRIERVVADLLELARIEAREAPDQEPVEVGSVVAQAVADHEPAAARRGIVIETEGVNRRLDVIGDRRQLVRAVSDLLDNAVRHSDSGASIVITARRTGSWVEVAVADEGPGIPAQQLERIFERFYKAGGDDSPGRSGLGLAIVRHVAEHHGGDVVVTSREGEGATFTLRLPAGPAPVVLSADAGEASDQPATLFWADEVPKYRVSAAQNGVVATEL